MSNHTSAWYKRKASLEDKEEKIKDELEEVSDHLKKRVKNILIITAVAGSAFGIGYGLYKAFVGPKEVKKPDADAHKKAKEESRQPHSLRDAIIEKAAFALIKVISAQIPLLLASKRASRKEP